jgi:hypothetical protein
MPESSEPVQPLRSPSPTIGRGYLPLAPSADILLYIYPSSASIGCPRGRPDPRAIVGLLEMTG